MGDTRSKAIKDALAEMARIPAQSRSAARRPAPRVQASKSQTQKLLLGLGIASAFFFCIPAILCTIKMAITGDLSWCPYIGGGLTLALVSYFCFWLGSRAAK